MKPNSNGSVTPQINAQSAAEATRSISTFISPCFFLKPIPRPITITSAPDFSYAEIILLLITF